MVDGSPLLYEILTVRVPELSRQVVNDVLRWTIVRVLGRAAVSVGWQTWTASAGGVALLIAWAGVSAGFIATAPLPIPGRRYGTLALIGTAWACLSFLPSLLVKGQWIDLRMLYLPWAGAALMTGAV